jgi:hypothetical protein
VLHRARQRYKELFERRTGREAVGALALLFVLGIILRVVPLLEGRRFSVD